MNKQEFLGELLSQLAALPVEEQDKAYAFYAEIIDDSIDDGLTEEEAVEKLGTMDEIIDRIVADTPQSAVNEEQVSHKSRSTGLWLLLILGFPLWFPVLISGAAVLLTLFICVWVTALLLWSALVSSGAVVIGGIIGLMINPQLGVRLMWLGSAMVGAGISILLYPICLWMTRQFIRVTRYLWNKGKNTVTKKGAIKHESFA